jgi:hypothetical protein
VAGAGGHEVGIAAVHHDPGNHCLAAQVLAAFAARLAFTAGGVVPGHADAVSDREVRDLRAFFHHAAHHLVPGDQVGLGDGLQHRLVTLGDVQVGVADPAGLDLDQHLIRLRSRPGHVLDAEGGPETVKDGSLHGVAPVKVDCREVNSRGCAAARG